MLSVCMPSRMIHKCCTDDSPWKCRHIKTAGQKLNGSKQSVQREREKEREKGKVWQNDKGVNTPTYLKSEGFLIFTY